MSEDARNSLIMLVAVSLGVAGLWLSIWLMKGIELPWSPMSGFLITTACFATALLGWVRERRRRREKDR